MAQTVRMNRAIEAVVSLLLLLIESQGSGATLGSPGFGPRFPPSSGLIVNLHLYER
jgi:hypothetical protein